MTAQARDGRRRTAWAAAAAGLLALMVAIPVGASRAGGEPLGVATVQLYVGDYRSGPQKIDPAVPGVTFGLWLTNPSASIRENDGFVDAATAPPLFTCASQPDGDCVFTVPIGTAATVTSDEVPQGTRLWAGPIAPPAGATVGYYANPFWQTAPLANTDQVSLRHLFQTPPLVAGQTYTAGADWVTDPGQTPSPPSTVTDYTRRVASGGVWPLSRYNLEMPEQCGLRVAIVVDLSSSVQQAGAVPSLVAAIHAFVDALHGTPSQAALYTFGTGSPANGFGPNSPLMPVATTADANEFKALYSGWTSTPTNYTNWDRALAAPAGVNVQADGTPLFDMVVMITDGNPTVYGEQPLTDGGSLVDRRSGYTRFREIGNGLASANLLKSQGTRILAVGVGTGVAGAGSEYNLRTISGRDAYDGTNILAADYLQTADYEAAGVALHDVVLASCAPSISLVKRIVPYDATDTSQATRPGSPWAFAASSTTPDVTITPPAGVTDVATGAMAFDLAFPAGPVSVTVTESLEGGFEPFVPPGATGPLVECVNKSADDVVVPVVTDTSTPGELSFDVPLGLEDAISCELFNRAPPDAEPASVVVDKRWRVVSAAGTQDALDGAQPAGMESSLSLSGPGSADLTEQSWGVPREGYDVSPVAPAEARAVTVSEHPTLTGLPGCVISDVTIESGRAQESEPASGTVLYSAAGASPPQVPVADPVFPDQELVAGENAWTLTNVVTCTSYLTLTKDVGDEDADLSWWDLTASSPEGALPGPTGLSGVRVPVTPGAEYTLAESVLPGSPHEALHYVQNDIRTRPLLFPASTGSWACSPSPSVGNEGAVVVPLGAEYECAALNRTALVTVSKSVVGGAAAPGDFRFTIDPLPPAIPGAHEHEVVPGVARTLAPGQRYALTETGVPDAYELTDLTCTTAGQPVDPADFAILPGASLECAATNTAVPPVPGDDGGGDGGTDVDPAGPPAAGGAGGVGSLPVTGAGWGAGLAALVLLTVGSALTALSRPGRRTGRARGTVPPGG